MSFKKEIENNLTLVVLIVVAIAAGFSDTVRNTLKENSLFSILIFIYIAVLDLKYYFEKLIFSREEGE